VQQRQARLHCRTTARAFSRAALICAFPAAANASPSGVLCRLLVIVILLLIIIFIVTRTLAFVAVIVRYTALGEPRAAGGLSRTGIA
jgi:hypothetical protein